MPRLAEVFRVITCTNSTALTCLSLIKFNGTMPSPVGQLFALAGRRGDANTRIARRKRSAVCSLQDWFAEAHIQPQGSRHESEERPFRKVPSGDSVLRFASLRQRARSNSAGGGRDFQDSEVSRPKHSDSQS